MPPTVPVENADALTQQMPRVRRRRPTAAIVSVGIAAVAVLAAGVTVLAVNANDAGTQHRPSAAATERASGGTRPAVPLTANVPLGDGRALLAKIAPAPRHAHVFSIDGSNHGVMNVSQYVARFFGGDQAGLSRLKNEGFQVSAATDFVRPDGLEVATHLVQFADADGALTFYLTETSAWNSNNLVSHTFASSGVADTVGYELVTVDSAGNRRAVMYARLGNIVVVINAYTRGPIDDDLDARLLMAQVTALR